MWRAGLISTGLLLNLSLAAAQDYKLPPTVDTIKLVGGFASDPRATIVTPGGPVDVAGSIEGCSGFVSEAPNVRVFYASPVAPLVFHVDATVDTTLLIHAPDGRWVCNDDRAGSINPLIFFRAPPSGRYDVWVGTYAASAPAPGKVNVSARLLISGDAGLAPIDYHLEPIFGEARVGGATPAPYRVEVDAGGDIDVAGLIEGCVGYATAAPSVRVIYTAGPGPVTIFAESAGDTTLVVNDPNGDWICDDDSGGNSNPLITLAAPSSGPYDVWLGTHAPGVTVAATLFMSELGGPAPVDIARPPAPVDIARPPAPGAVDRSLPPLAGEADLVAGFAGHPHELSVDVGYDFADAGLGEECRGYVTVAPTYRLSYRAGGFALAIAARSEVDMTLIVMDPAGGVHCDDDSGDGSNPTVTFEDPADGTYDIWVGLYSLGQGAPVPAMLAISEIAGPKTGGVVLDLNQRPLNGSADLRAELVPDPFEVELTAGGAINARETVDDTCRGYMGPEPSFMFFNSGGGPLAIWVDSERDTTLVVHTPAGEWLCNDDGGVGETPALRWDEPLSGLYHLWVGTYRLSPQPATLNFSRMIDPIDPTPDPPEFMKMPGG